MTATLTPAPSSSQDAPGLAGPLRRYQDLLLLGGALPFVLVGLARATRFAEGDTYWQVVTGAEILARGTTSLVENDSWTAAGTPWHPNSWLYDVLVHQAWALGGWAGLGWFTLLTIAALGAVVAVVGRALGASAWTVSAASAAVAIPLVGWLSARPQTVSYSLLLLVVWLAARVVLRSGPRSTAVGAVGLAGLTALWVNIHLAALSAVAAVAGGIAVVVLAGSWRPLLRGRLPGAPVLGRLGRSAVVLTAVGLGCAASPLGTGILGAANHTRDASTAIITEWAPLWRAELTPLLTWVAAAVALAVLAGCWWRAERHGTTPTWLPFWTGAVGTLLLAGVTAARFSPMALVLAVPAVAAVAPRTLPSTLPWLVRRLAVALPAAIGAAVLAVAVGNIASFGRPGPVFPTLATVAAIPDGCRVLNEYDEGGLLTLLRRDDGVLVSADGRNDVYGIDVLLADEELLRGTAGALDALDERGVGCLLLEPDRPLVAQALAAGWQLTAQDANRVLLVRP